MIQRIQTMYLLVVVAIGAGLSWLLNLWVTNDGVVVLIKDDIYIFAAFIASAVLALISIGLFKNRQTQFVINRLNTILNLILLGVFVYRSLNLSGESVVSEKGIGMILPVVSIVFLVLANRAIKRDEKLVKSADRFR